MANKLYFYTKPNCKLCDEAKVLLLSLQAEYGFDIIEQNINDDEELLEKYFIEIPVVRINQAELTAAELDLYTLESFLNTHFAKD
ncbi:glutaredoxin family protein [Bacillaceae bacterium W0354]